MRYAFVFVLLLTIHCPSLRADWPQFRGPGAQGHAESCVLPEEWSESKNVAWKIKLPGTGWSSPVLVKGNLTMLSGAGREAWKGTMLALCRCGASKAKPFCDGTHSEIGFEAE